MSATTRKGPKESANDARVGETRKGLDGTMWVAVRVTPRDRKRVPYKQWRRAPAAAKGETVAELRQAAKKRGIKGYTRMKKAELVRALKGVATAPKTDDGSAGYLFYYDNYHVVYEILLIITKVEAAALAKECEKYRAWNQKLWAGKAPLSAYESRQFKQKVSERAHVWDSGFYLANIEQYGARLMKRPTTIRKLTWAAVKRILTEPYGVKAPLNMGYKMLPMTEALYDKLESFD